MKKKKDKVLAAIAATAVIAAIAAIAVLAVRAVAELCETLMKPQLSSVQMILQHFSFLDKEYCFKNDNVEYIYTHIT